MDIWVLFFISLAFTLIGFGFFVEYKMAHNQFEKNIEAKNKAFGDWYKFVLDHAQCEYCGKKYRDKEPSDVWNTEFDCGCQAYPMTKEQMQAIAKAVKDGVNAELHKI